MFKNLYLLLFLILSINANAQENRTDEPFNLPSNIIGPKGEPTEFYKNIVGELNGHYFILTQQNFSVMILTKYDSLLRPVKELKIVVDSDKDGNRKMFYSLEIINDSLCLFTSALITNNKE